MEFRKEKWDFLSPDDSFRVNLGKIEKDYLNFRGRDVKCPVEKGRNR